jgi:pyruvate dehydrogenase E2 component (dihydrolipoamide acetyltransferase)
LQSIEDHEGKPALGELGNGTFTLNNYGVFKLISPRRYSTILRWQSSVLGRIIDSPWVEGGKITQVTATFEYPACDGATAGRSRRFDAYALENPGSVLADI